MDRAPYDPNNQPPLVLGEGSYQGTKPKPRWDVHLPGVVNQAGSLTGLPRPLTGGSSGSAVSPLLSGGSILPGTGRPSPAPLPCSRGTDCL